MIPELATEVQSDGGHDLTGTLAGAAGHTRGFNDNRTAHYAIRKQRKLLCPNHFQPKLARRLRSLRNLAGNDLQQSPPRRHSLSLGDLYLTIRSIARLPVRHALQHAAATDVSSNGRRGRVPDQRAIVLICCDAVVTSSCRLSDSGAGEGSGKSGGCLAAAEHGAVN